MDLDACITRLTGKTAKDAYAFTQQIVEESRASDTWYLFFDRFAELLRHKNSLVRNRAIAILAANARWDREGKFDALLDEFLSHVTDVKPITARQCVAALPEVAEAKPELLSLPHPGGARASRFERISGQYAASDFEGHRGGSTENRGVNLCA